MHPVLGYSGHIHNICFISFSCSIPKISPSNFFLDQRLNEPDFELIKPFKAEFTNAAKQLTGNKYNKHVKKKKKMKSHLIPKALVLPCSSTEEEAMSM
jgi:hypothetical protein